MEEKYTVRVVTKKTGATIVEKVFGSVMEAQKYLSLYHIHHRKSNFLSRIIKTGRIEGTDKFSVIDTWQYTSGELVTVR